MKAAHWVYSKADRWAALMALRLVEHSAEQWAIHSAGWKAGPRAVLWVFPSAAPMVFEKVGQWANLRVELKVALKADHWVYRWAAPKADSWDDQMADPKDCHWVAS